MASCDVVSCIMYLVSPERRAADAEAKAARLGALYQSYVVETEKQLQEAMRKGHANLEEVRRCASAPRSDPAATRVRAAARATAAKVRDLRERCDKYQRLADSCERAITQLREAHQYRVTVGALRGVQSQFKNLRLDDLVKVRQSALPCAHRRSDLNRYGGIQGAETAANDVSEAHDNLKDIGSILGAPLAPVMLGTPAASTEEDVEAELAALLGEPPQPTAGTSAHVQLPASSRTRTLPSMAEYAQRLEAAT